MPSKAAGGAFVIYYRSMYAVHGAFKVGIPGATVGLQARDVTIAESPKRPRRRDGEFGKNHLGDRNEYLLTVHGFDEFFGNL